MVVNDLPFHVECELTSVWFNAQHRGYVIGRGGGGGVCSKKEIEIFYFSSNTHFWYSIVMANHSFPK